MSATALQWAWRQPIEAASLKLLLVKLADQANDDGECWPSRRTIADDCGKVTIRTVARWLADLERQGYLKRIERKRENGSRTSSLYVLACHPPRDAHVTPPVTQLSHPQEEPPDEPSGTTDVVPASNAGTLTGWFVDESRARGSDPPRRVVGQMARTIGELLAEGQSVERVRAGIREMLDRNLHPAALPSAVHTAGLPAPKPRRVAGTVTPEELYAHALSLEDP